MFHGQIAYRVTRCDDDCDDNNPIPLVHFIH